MAVDDNDLSRAVELLGLAAKSDSKSVRCPECGSEECDFSYSCRGRPVKRPLFSFVLFILLLLAGGNTGAIRRDYHCKVCDNRF